MRVKKKIIELTVTDDELYVIRDSLIEFQKKSIDTMNTVMANKIDIARDLIKEMKDG